MTIPSSGALLVIAIAPMTRGFAYVVFEGSQWPIDWGVKEVRGDKNRESLKCIKQLIEWFRPDALLLEGPAGKGVYRSERIRNLVRNIERLAARASLPLHQVPRAQIRARFAPIDATTKHEIAQAIVTQLPELEPWLPHKRRPWESQDPRLSIFDAAALVFTFFADEKGTYIARPDNR